MPTDEDPRDEPIEYILGNISYNPSDHEKLILWAIADETVQ